MDLQARDHSVFALRRSATPPPRGVIGVQGDLTSIASLGSLPPQLDAVVFAAGPSASTQEAYRATYVDGVSTLLRALGEQGEEPRRFLFCSSTSVYGQRRGEEVTEASVTRPTRFAGDTLLSAEGLVRASGLEAASVRFGGIYGPGRTGLLQRIARGELLLGDQPHFTNRIHRDDAAGVLAHLLRCETLEPIYLGVDCEPVEMAELARWVAERVGADAPRRASDVGEAEPKQRAGSKRCSNARLLASGYRFLYPSYREGYAPLLAELETA